jgi:hypothetical protein
MDLDTWQKHKYETVFEDVCHFVAYQRETDPEFTMARLEGLLQMAYQRSGDDWDGRGLVNQLALSATVAAYEHCLTAWKQEAHGVPLVSINPLKQEALPENNRMPEKECMGIPPCDPHA